MQVIDRLPAIGTTIDDDAITLRELRIIPRRLDFRLMAGSFWIDETSHAVVRALIRDWSTLGFRPSGVIDTVEDGSAGGVKLFADGLCHQRGG